MATAAARLKRQEPLIRKRKTVLIRTGLLMEGPKPILLLRLLTPNHALVTKDAATQHGAMRKSDACACNSAHHKSTRRDPAIGPVALCT
jgi:hypothetical protein